MDKPRPKTPRAMDLSFLQSKEPAMFRLADEIRELDNQEREVAAAGHDRTIINIKPEHVQAWLNQDPTDLQALYAIFDDKRHPYYEHKIAA